MATRCVWANCVGWLERCGVLSPQQASTIDNMQQLASFVRDGVLLCHLANKLHPNAIDLRDFSQKPKNSQFLCKKNIDAFLYAAKNVFGIKERDLFNQTEILEMTNFGKVLVTLSKLSELESVKRQQIRPFSIEIDAIYAIMEDKIEDEIYTTSSVYDTKLSDLDESEKIYQSLVISFQKNTMNSANNSDRRIEELLTTEKNYLTVLTDIKSKFLDQLRNIVSEDKIQNIFYNLEDILALHKRFYAHLLAKKSSSLELASCFITYKMEMTIYGDYCAHLPTVVKQISLLCEFNPAASEIIDKGFNEVKVKLADILTMPFQRFFKYPLLLKEIIKNLLIEECDELIIEKWKEALANVEDLALYINELTGGKESLLEMDAITKSLEGGLSMHPGCKLTDYGRRLFDGEFNYKSPRNRSFEVRHIFLFEKLILLCKPTKKNFFKYQENILVRKSTVSIETLEKEKQLWLTNDQKVHVFTSKKEETLYKLEEFIYLALDINDPAGADVNGYSFVLTNFNEPKSCDVCKNLLRGALSQGYQCRKTSKIVHKECILQATNSVSYKQGDILIATSNYSGQPKFGQNTPLIFLRGDKIEFIQSNSGLWLQGRFNDKVGYFPYSKIKLFQRSRRNRPGYEEHDIKMPPLSNGAMKPILPKQTSPVMDLHSYPWYVDDEVEDNSIFDKCLDGTFLVRTSTKDDLYTIVLKYLRVRKLKIKHKDGSYYLGNLQSRTFPSVIELIEFYRINSLSEIFNQIESTLKYVYKERDSLLTCIAKYDFSATQPNHLSFHKNDVIQVLIKSEKVWWQGTLRNESGFFPRSYVD